MVLAYVMVGAMLEVGCYWMVAAIIGAIELQSV